MRELNLQEIQHVGLGILQRIAELCEEQALHYCLAYGTLLGAARHQGFIPWDDDIDIQMPRRDYDRLLSYFIENEEKLLPLKLHCQETNRRYPFAIARISHTGTTIEIEDEENYGIGVFVDIYPYDGIGNDRETALETLTYCNLLRIRMIEISRKNRHVPDGLNWKGRVMWRIESAMHRLLGRKYYYRKICETARKWEWTESEYAGCLTWAYAKAPRALFRREQFDELTTLPFCGKEYCVPKDYDTILRQIYGDYMQLPPENQRWHRHKYRAYSLND